MADKLVFSNFICVHIFITKITFYFLYRNETQIPLGIYEFNRSSDLWNYDLFINLYQHLINLKVMIRDLEIKLQK